MNWKLRKAFTGNNISDVQTINGYIAAGEDNDFSVEVSPVGKEYPAPLVVPRTNIITQSEDFGGYNNSNSTDVPNATTSPDGLTNATSFLEAATTGQHKLSTSVIFDGSSTYTFSVFAKSNGRDLYIDTQNSNEWGGRAWFDLTAGTANAFLGTADIQNFGNGWYRCSVTGASTLAGSNFVEFLTSIGATNSTIGDITKGVYIYGAQLEQADKVTEYIPTNGAAVTRSWDSFSRVQNQVPGICNGTHTHTGAASGGGIAATTLTGTGSGGKFKYEFDTLGKLVLIEADDAGQGYKVDDKLSITTNEGHDIEFRLVEGSNATTVTVGMEATKPSKPVPFPVTKMRVADSTDRQVLIMDQRSRYVFPKPTPYLLDNYEGAAAAYSLRRLRSAYTGPAVRVRRESNNDELDIYFDGQGNLDTAALEAFCAGTNGFVKVWYDQGPGGIDAEQTTTAHQPKMYDSSTGVLTENGKPCIERVSGSSELLFSLAGNANQHHFTVAKAAVNNFVLTNDSSDAGKYYLVGQDGTGTSPYGNVTGGDFYLDGTLSNSTVSSRDNVHDALINTQHLISQKINNSSYGSAQYFGYKWSSVFNMMNLQEVIFYNSDQYSNRTGIETNINDYYNIY